MGHHRQTTHDTIRSSIVAVAWHEIDHHRVDFQNDGSFIIEIRHIVPSQSILEIVFEYEAKFINVAYFPADANHGFEIPPMIVKC